MSCCPSVEETNSIYQSVQEYYGKVLQKSSDLKTSACSAASRPHPIICGIISTLPDEVNSKFYGCGNPIPLGIEGLHLLDLGSGSGRDCYIAAKLVGPNGSVTGVDMTDEQLQVARDNVDKYTLQLGYTKPNLKFVKGYIEQLEQADIASHSIDLVISNCVVNLSPNKQQVLSGVYQVLKSGGEFYYSDICCDRRVASELKQNDVLLNEGMAGALYLGDYLQLMRETGFRDPRILNTSPITIYNEEIKDLVGEARFFAVTFRLFKVPDLEPQREDYGQYAVYKGTIPGYKSSYTLDNEHAFETNKPTLVCGNTASILQNTWLAKYFEVIGSRDVHYGAFTA